jgi:4'-phosphopantetheinyl transferase
LEPIYCLVQTYQDLPEGDLPTGVLTLAEQAYYARLQSEARRQDWLLGRWTGKRLVQAVIGAAYPLEAIEILPADDGAPLVRVGRVNGTEDTAAHPQPPALSLSLSHSHGHALGALVEGAGVPLGVDIERVAPRPAGFVEDFFGREETALVESVPGTGRETLITAIWSAKEAALKAVRVGLLTDTTVVCCLPEGDGKGWSPLAIKWEVHKLGRSVPALEGWWRVVEGFVWTVAAVQRKRGNWLHEVRGEWQPFLSYDNGVQAKVVRRISARPAPFDYAKPLEFGRRTPLRVLLTCFACTPITLFLPVRLKREVELYWRTFDIPTSDKSVIFFSLHFFEVM